MRDYRHRPAINECIGSTLTHMAACPIFAAVRHFTTDDRQLLDILFGTVPDQLPGTSTMELDHVVIWVADPLRSLDFYVHVVGLAPVRADEFRSGTAPFPSVRVTEGSIIDLTPRGDAAAVDTMTKTTGTAGHPVNHICIAMSGDEYAALSGRLEAHGVDTSSRRVETYGARGLAPHAFYFRDPDDNVIEARHYA
jgi:glyoxylase I family protein